MSKQFTEQGGAATMDPSRLLRWVTSRVMSKVSRADVLEKRRARTEQARRRDGLPHVVEYFHQVEDGYSHLAAQVLAPLCARYDIQLVCHLVSGPSGKNAPEPELLLRLSRYDAAIVAPEYGLDFPGVSAQDNPPPDSARVTQATAILAGLDSAGFVQHAAAVGDALWRADQSALDALASSLGTVDNRALAARLAAGDARLAQLKHYSGAMFFYGGEWYWGVDRLYHLEKRLAALEVDKHAGQPLLVARPPVETGPLQGGGHLTLEIYPSLRSPYTSISFDRTVALARATGVDLVVRPVLPMVMRGVPATRQKGIYIFTDTAREAREAGVDYGNFYDPIGNPARRCYSLYPWAKAQGKDVELISSFLRCAFAKGVNTNKTRGLRKVVEAAGLDWAEAQQHLGDSAWEEILEANRQSMYEAGLWGVPSFRLLNGDGEPLLALWGQDRLWLISRVIQRELAKSG
ncbi:MAG: DsbA family protein [Gammaproteobacteria bacterium]|nr:DsbA family protein [Gammaproteobacteria bacterium]